VHQITFQLVSVAAVLLNIKSLYLSIVLQKLMFVYQNYNVQQSIFEHSRIFDGHFPLHKSNLDYFCDF